MKKRIFLSIFLSLSLVSVSAFAEEVTENREQASNVAEPTPKGENGQVGTEPLPDDLRDQMESKRIEKQQEYKARIEKRNTSVVKMSSQSRLPVQAMRYTRSFHTYTLIGVSDDARFIDLDDGSRWEIAPSDTYKVKRWRGDEIYSITPNSNWLSSDYYTYTITNKHHESSAKAKLILGANTNSTKAHWIVNFDDHRNLVYLENGTVWKVASDDLPYFERWKINHMVIIGDYYPWFYIFYPYDSILINVNMDHYVHARQD